MKTAQNRKGKPEAATASSGDPFRKFDVAFALMVIIPFLGFFFIIIEALTIYGFEGRRGWISLLLIFISLLGYTVGYRVIRHLFEGLICYNRALSRLNELKSVFVSEVSHEVKNPLVTLRLGLAFLNENLASSLNEDQRQVIGSCHRSVDRLIRMTNDLLDLAKIESGKMPMQVEEVNLKSLLEEVMGFIKPRIQEKDLIFNVEFSGNVFSMMGDGDHLTRLMINLLDNAIKYTSNNRRMGVSLGEGKRHFELDVWNEGDEIPPEKQDRIFERYERMVFDKNTGTGLGLPIVKELLKLHNGSIRVERRNSANHFIANLPKNFRG